MPGTGTVYRWELRKLLAQKRTYIGLGAAVVAPLVQVAALVIQPGSRPEALFGPYLRETGLAHPLYLLGFGAAWLFPFLTAIVAGDLFAAEEQDGTLKTYLTRSVSRGQVFAGKALAAVTYTLAAMALMALTATLAGGIAYGFGDLYSLSGTLLAPGRALGLIAASWALVAVLPVLAFTSLALFFSVVTRYSVAGVIGPMVVALLLRGIGGLGLGGGTVREYLLTTQFEAWHGLLDAPVFWGDIARALWLTPLYAALPLAAAFAIFARRDVTSG